MADLVEVLAPVICEQEPYCKGLAGTGCPSAPPCFAIIQTRAILTALEAAGYRVVPKEDTAARVERYRNDPVAFFEEHYGLELMDWQKDALRALVKYKSRRPR